MLIARCNDFDPGPVVERSGDTVRLVVGAEQKATARGSSCPPSSSAVELRRLLDGVGRDLAGFLALASDRVHRRPPGHAEPVIGALVRVLAVPANGGTRRAS